MPWICKLVGGDHEFELSAFKCTRKLYKSFRHITIFYLCGCHGERYLEAASFPVHFVLIHTATHYAGRHVCAQYAMSLLQPTRTSEGACFGFSHDTYLYVYIIYYIPARTVYKKEMETCELCTLTPHTVYTLFIYYILL